MSAQPNYIPASLFGPQVPMQSQQDLMTPDLMAAIAGQQAAHDPRYVGQAQAGEDFYLQRHADPMSMFALAHGAIAPGHTIGQGLTTPVNVPANAQFMNPQGGAPLAVGYRPPHSAAIERPIKTPDGIYSPATGDYLDMSHPGKPIMVQLPSMSGKSAKQPAPPIGTILKGHRFLGGDPSQQSSWEPITQEQEPTTQ
jgi:hypothetical protein